MSESATERDAEAARAAGLERALSLFPEDVAAAMTQAKALRETSFAPLAPEDEPWRPAPAAAP